MIRTIHLHGDLGQHFQNQIRMDVASCAEAIRALCTMLPGFREHIQCGAYRVIAGALGASKSRAQDEIGFGLGPAVTDIHFVPAVVGGKDDEGLGKVLLGSVLIAASFVIPGSAAIFGKSLGAMAGQMGVSIALGGVGQMLSGTDGPSSDGTEASELFSGSPNQAVPGSAIPVIFGEYEANVKIISAAVHLEDRV